jgi:uncharacterized protein YeaO (DUF488 family)
MITIKRIYVAADDNDGTRVLVDRLWPRGVKKETARIDLWAKGIAPSTELRQWYDHQAERWDEFQLRYTLELANAEAKAELAKLQAMAKTSIVTLLTATRNETQNHAVFLQSLLNR